MAAIIPGGYRIRNSRKAKKVQQCSNDQIAIDKRLGYHPLTSRGLEAVDRKNLNRIAKKYNVKCFKRTSTDIISDLRRIAANMQ